MKQPKTWDQLYKKASKHRRGDSMYWPDDMFNWMQKHFKLPKIKKKKNDKPIS